MERNKITIEEVDLKTDLLEKRLEYLTRISFDVSIFGPQIIAWRTAYEVLSRTRYVDPRLTDDVVATLANICVDEALALVAEKEKELGVCTENPS